MSVVNGLLYFVEFFVFSFFGLSEFAKAGLFELYFVGVVFFDGFSFDFMLLFEFGEFLNVFLFHAIDFFYFFVVFHFFCPLAFGYFVVEFIDEAVIELLCFLVGFFALLFLLSIRNFKGFLEILELD